MLIIDATVNWRVYPHSDGGLWDLSGGANEIDPSSLVPAAWRHAAEVEKTMLEWPAWPTVAPLPTGPRVRTRNDTLHTSAAETVSVVIPLAEKAGPGLEGVRLRLTAWAFRREYDVTATLEVFSARFVTIARIDAWPTSPHANVRARGVSGLHRVPLVVDGHHVHRFADNARLGREAFTPQGNLPIAVPVEGTLRSFREFARIVASEFRVDGLGQIDPPESWRLLI